MLVKLKLVSAFMITSRAERWSLGLLKEVVLMFNMLQFLAAFTQLDCGTYMPHLLCTVEIIHLLQIYFTTEAKTTHVDFGMSFLKECYSKVDVLGKKMCNL